MARAPASVERGGPNISSIARMNTKMYAPIITGVIGLLFCHAFNTPLLAITTVAMMIFLFISRTLREHTQEHRDDKPANNDTNQKTKNMYTVKFHDISPLKLNAALKGKTDSTQRNNRQEDDKSGRHRSALCIFKIHYFFSPGFQPSLRNV